MASLGSSSTGGSVETSPRASCACSLCSSSGSPESASASTTALLKRPLTAQSCSSSHHRVKRVARRVGAAFSIAVRGTHVTAPTYIAQSWSIRSFMRPHFRRRVGGGRPGLLPQSGSFHGLSPRSAPMRWAQAKPLKATAFSPWPGKQESPTQ